MKKSNFSKLGWTISLFFTALYLICLLWQFLLTDPALQTLHAQLLALTFPGFTWLSTGSFFLGLILSFVYGWIGAGLYVWLHSSVCSSEGTHGKSSGGGCCK